MAEDSLFHKAKGWSRRNRDRMRHALAMLSKRHKVYSNLFLGADGTLTPDAEWFFNEISRLAGMHLRGFEPDARRADFLAARADLVEAIKDGLRLDGAKMAALNAKLKEPLRHD